MKKKYSDPMKCKYCAEILVGVVAGFLGIMVGAGIMFWARLPDRTVDLLTFSESAFGIGITVIALIFALVTVNQIKEIDSRFAELSTDIEETSKKQFVALKEGNYETLTTVQSAFQRDIQAATESLNRAERAADISTTNYTTAMTSIGKLDERGGRWKGRENE
jgi:hypothetical protein